MDVLTGSVAMLMLGMFSGVAMAPVYHESLQPGILCSSEDYPYKFEILETPEAADGFFKVSDGLCHALELNADEDSTLFPVAQCMDSRSVEFTLYFGGWLNMLTAQFKDENGDKRELICR